MYFTLVREEHKQKRGTGVYVCNRIQSTTVDEAPSVDTVGGRGAGVPISPRI